MSLPLLNGHFEWKKRRREKKQKCILTPPSGKITKFIVSKSSDRSILGCSSLRRSLAVERAVGVTTG